MVTENKQTELGAQLSTRALLAGRSPPWSPSLAQRQGNKIQ